MVLTSTRVKKRTANENLANPSLSATSSGNKRMELDGHQVAKGEGPVGFDPRVIKKRITDSEIQKRLRLPVDGVKYHILPQWDKRGVDSIKNGVRVAVWDCDTKCENQLRMGYETSTNATYCFIGNWTKEFVVRRGLKKGDEIGLHWDPSNSRFCLAFSSGVRVINPHRILR